MGSKNPALNAWLLIVIALHVLFLLVILISPTFVLHKKQHKPLTVKTLFSNPPAKTTASEKKNSHQNTLPSSSPNPMQKAVTAQKPQTPKAQGSAKKEQALKNLSQKPTPTIKKEPAIADKQLSQAKPLPAKKTSIPLNRAKISDSLLKELEDSIAKIENKSSKVSTGKALAPIPLQIDIAPSENFEEGQSPYTEGLVNHLHQYLRLPDYGEVKIQLSLRQDGTVVKVIVLKSQSEKNKQYLESHLPRLKFSRFDDADANKKEYTFILTFCNE